MSSKYTIADIAKLSGVSKGTVDRVLHNRGRVSQKALEKVNTVLENIDYSPNVMAKQLKRTRDYQIYLLIPDPELDAYWSTCQNIIKKKTEEFQNLGIQLNYIFFDPFNAKSFVQNRSSIDFENIDLLILAPIFFNESLFFINQLKHKEIPFIIFNSTTEVVGALTFIGQDLEQSGRLAGHLLHLLANKTGVINSYHLLEDYENTVHMKKKQIGLGSYLLANEQDYLVQSLNFKDRDTIAKDIEQSLIDFAPIGLFVSNSKAEYIAEELVRIDRKIPFVAYDLTPKSRKYLKEGVIDFIIQQNPSKQLELACSIASDYLIFNKKPNKLNYLPLEVISKENI